MSRKKREHDCEDSGWEIALADLMTVLMVFFLVMWLTSIMDPEKRKSFVESVMGESSGGEQIEEEVVDDIGKKAQEVKPEITVEDVKEALSEVKAKDIDIEETPEGIKVTLRSDSFFESGRANITDSTRAQLEKLGEALAGREQEISITGFTDNVPISNFQFPSNWELSSSRAATVARIFIYMGLNQKWVTIQGKADNEPVAQNNSPYGRSLNRRVVILIKQRDNQPKIKPIY